MGLLIGGVLLAGGATGALAQSDVTLRVGNYGGAFNAVEHKYVVELFTARTGIKVEWVNANPSDHLTKMIQSKGHEAPYDAVYLDDNIQVEAMAAGVLSKVNASEIPNLNFLYDEAKNPEGFGPAMNFYSVGIAYNVEKFEAAGIPAPVSWADLWDPRLAGHIGVPTLDNTMGRAFLIAAEHLNGGNESTPEKGIEKIAQIKAHSYPVSSATIDALLSSGDLWVTPWMNGRTWGLIGRGVPLKFVLPKEGGYFGMTTIDVVAGTPHRKEALAYLNAVLDPLSELGMANEIPYGPTNKLLATVLAAYPEMAQKFPASSADIAKLNKIDWPVFNKAFSKAVNLWNRQIATK